MGVPDEVMGESGRAYIIKAPGSELTGEVVFRDMLPLTPSQSPS